LVLVSVLVHNASESRGKFGLMQVLGFTRSQLLGAQFAQVCSILLAGAAGGIVAGYVAIKLLRPSLGTFFEHISLPSWSWMWLLLGLGVLLASIMLPLSLILRRVRPVDCREL
jgi:ABC-type antimicrobial peptide transport system permease subunit